MGSNSGKNVITGKPRGRPKKADKLALIDALSAKFPPDYVTEKLEEAMDLATKQKSSRGMINVLRFIAEYTEGLPVKRVIHSQDGYDRLADLMQQVREEQAQALAEDDPNVIVIDNPPKELEKFEKRQE